MEKWLSIEEVKNILGISQAKVYELKNDPKVEKILGREIKFTTEPTLAYASEDIQELQNNYLRIDTRKVVSLMNHKGGVSKTTSTANIGVVLARKGYRVLLIDIDPQANLTSSFKYITEDKTIDYQNANLFHFFERTHTLLDVIYETRIENLHIAPSVIRLAEIPLSNVSKTLLRKALEDISSFHYILIDTPPSISELTSYALISSTDVLIPIELDMYSIDGLLGMLKSINIARENNKRLNILGMFPALVKKISSSSDLIRKNLPKEPKLINTEIPYAEEARKANALRQTVSEYNPSHAVSKSYIDLVMEVFNV